MLFLRLPAMLLSALASLLIAGSALAADLPALVGSLTTGSFGDRETAVGALAISAPASAITLVSASMDQSNTAVISGPGYNTVNAQD